MREALVEALRPFIGETGFRPEFVATMASSLYGQFKIDDLDHFVPSWRPSPAWTYKFMRDELGCSFRRGTISRPNLEVIDEMTEHHQLNLRRCALIRADFGYQHWQFMTNDQFGSLTSNLLTKEEGEMMNNARAGQ
jgi:hypothetical protein